MGILSFLDRKKVQSPSPASPVCKASPAPSVAAMDASSYHASDHGAWVLYLRQALRTYRKPGLTMQEEYALWTADRERGRKAAEANNPQAARA